MDGDEIEPTKGANCPPKYVYIFIEENTQSRRRNNNDMCELCLDGLQQC